MTLDFTSLILAITISGSCIAATLLAAWLASRTDGFLLTCAIGAILVAVSGVASAFYAVTPSTVLVTLAYALLLAGNAAIYGAAWQFRYGGRPWTRVTAASAVTLGIILPFFVLGYNGIGFVLGFIGCAILLVLTSFHYWKARDEAPGTVMAIAGLYFIVALSFVPRALLVILDGKAVMIGPPRNWAQTLGLAIIIAALPSIGAMTMVLNQKRLVRAHRREAMTDQMTGLLNRRALFETYEGNLKEPVVAILFDIDRFKIVNDTHGHACGDRVIALFARAMRECLEEAHCAARIGGEEFALIQPHATMEAALALAEAVRARFAALVLSEERLACTASAGLACGDAFTTHLDAVLLAADQSLYQAKREGRDRVIIADPHSPPGGITQRFSSRP
ncbi:MAG TPA: GGDEF domain-containing protein [Ancylobacter sp.]